MALMPLVLSISAANLVTYTKGSLVHGSRMFTEGARVVLGVCLAVPSSDFSVRQYMKADQHGRNPEYANRGDRGLKLVAARLIAVF